MDFNGTMTLVLVKAGKVAKKMVVASMADLRRHFPTKKGKPCIGPNVYVELTHAQLRAAGKPASHKRHNYLDCLVPAEGLFS